MQLAKMLRAQRPTATLGTKLEVPKTFLGFLDWIGVVPQPGQAELARVAFDRVEPVDRALAVTIFGDIDFANVPMGARDVVAAVCGGRGGKTYLLVALRLVWGMLVRDLSPLAPGQQAAATVVAPNDKLRQEAVNYALGAMRSKPELAMLLRLPRGTGPEDVVSEFGVWRADFKRTVTFQAAKATRGGYAVRGVWHTDLALDEAAFFRDSTYKVNDDEIFKAGKPRVLPGGQTMVDSTPWAETGLLYELWETNFGKPTTALVAHAPTLVLNDVPYTRAIVEAEYKRDPENAAREFGAQFMTGGTSVFFPPALIESLVDDTLDVDVPRMPKPTDEVAAGGDLGFRSDSSSLAVTHNTHPVIVLAELVEEKPEPGKPLRPSVVIKHFATRMKAHGIDTMMGDQYYRETAAEHLEEAGLSFADAPATPDVVYVRARQIMREGNARIPRHPRLIQQLKEVQSRPLPGGRMQIIQPKWAKGGHGDLASSYVLGLWQLVSEATVAPKPDEGSREWEQAAQARRKARVQTDLDRPDWMPKVVHDRGSNAGWRK